MALVKKVHRTIIDETMMPKSTGSQTDESAHLFGELLL